MEKWIQTNRTEEETNPRKAPTVYRLADLSSYRRANQFIESYVSLWSENRSATTRYVIAFEDNQLAEVVDILQDLDRKNPFSVITLVSPFLAEIGLDDASGQLEECGRFTFELSAGKRQRTERFARFCDLASTSVALPFLFPLHLLALAVLKATSKGPGIYRSTRIGLGEENFTILKYRTMWSTSDDSIHRDFLNELYDNQQQSSLANEEQILKLEFDPRVTPLGRIMRKLSIDELPQIWNVFRGDMSLIGPRPCIDYEFERMAPWQKNRFKAIPGLSGIWQVYGRSRCSIEQSHFLDNLFYFSQSPTLYLRLFIKTPIAILSARGAC